MTKRFYLEKVRHIVLPFIVLSLVTVPVYMALRWALDLRFGLVQLDEELWDFWIPFLLPWIPLLTIFRKRFHVLTFKRDDDRGRWLLQIICAFSLGGALVVSQHYLKAVAGGLKDLESVAQLDPKDHVRHFRIGHYVVASWMGGSHGTAHTSGRYNQDLNLEFFVVAPMLNDSAENLPSGASVWYGVKFHERMSNRASDAEKESRWKALMTRVEEEMNVYDFHDLDHFRRVPVSEDRKAFLVAIANRAGATTGEEVILTPVHEPYGAGTGTTLAWIFGALGIGCALLLFALLWSRFDDEEYARQLAGDSSTRTPDELDDWYTWLIPKRGRYATALLVDINLIVFIAMVLSGVSFISPRSPDLVAWGANTTAHTAAGEWWRIVTCLFIHGGFMHLLMNLFGLVIAGILLETMLGSVRYALVYFASGIAASLSSLCWHDQVVSVGASGAVFGLLGALGGILLLQRRSEFDASRGLLMFVALYAGLNLVLGFILPGIDNAAHIGGLLCGLVLGPALYYSYAGRERVW